MNPDATPRVNPNGHLCPPWCTTDHGPRDDGDEPYEFHGGRTRVVAVGNTPVGARAVEDGTGRGQPAVLAGSMLGPGSLWLNLLNADQLAQLIDLLADATPAQHREIAETIRATVRALSPPETPEVIP